MTKTNDDGRTISNTELENLVKIFDKNRKIETDADLLELAELVEDESDETENFG